MKKRIVVGIPYDDPRDSGDLLAGMNPPIFYPLQILEVPDGQSPHNVLQAHVEPKQHIWTLAGKLSTRAEAYYVERLKKNVPTILPETELTAKERAELQKVMDDLQRRIQNDAMLEFNPRML